MNIYIPHYWLLEHLETDADPQTIASCLSLCGPSVERIETIESEPVYDIEITTNRVDMMSVRGIAREAAAILPEFGIKASLKPAKDALLDTISTPLGIDIVNDPRLNHRILAIKIANVQIAPSPQWLQKRLLQVGQRPLNNIIDVTNYVMWEIGHPIHAFDYDRLEAKKIIVRTANPGESFVTLDNNTHTTVGGEVIYDDGTGTIIDLPGIMGTANTVVTNETKNVLLWVEANDGQKIRFTSMKHALRSQAAVLNEKHVDPTLGKNAIERATQLTLEIAQGAIGSTLYDEYPSPNDPQPISLEKKKLESYMGIAMEPERIQTILEHLGFAVNTTGSTNEKVFIVTPPSYRATDVTIAQDVIEEIARIWGYHNFPSVVMDTAIPDNPDQYNFFLEHHIKTWLAGWGAQEVYTYSMVSKKLATQSGYAVPEHITIKNPLNDEYEYMRRTLLPSLAEVARKNPHNSRALFELQNIYIPNSDTDKENALPQEALMLSLLMPNSYSKLKGIVEALFQKLHIESVFIPDSAQQNVCFDLNTTARIQTKSGQMLGMIGRVSDNLGDHIYGAEIDYKELAKHHRLYPHAIKITANPPIIEDLTFTLPHNSYVGMVSATIQEASSLIESVTIKSTYHQNVTFTLTYRSLTENLSNEMIEPVRKQIIEAVGQAHAGTLVGEV
jgi:phenylalanyl-tRNA synthetase beta chain